MSHLIEPFYEPVHPRTAVDGMAELGRMADRYDYGWMSGLRPEKAPPLTAERLMETFMETLMEMFPDIDFAHLMGEDDP